MASILLKNCKLIFDPLDGIKKNCDVVVEDNKIKEITKSDVKRKEADFDEVIDCENKLVMPGLVNMHTHAAMVLMRGYNDDADLHSWLNSVWKVEANLKKEDVYIGSLFACIEMIKTGTVFFTDMYFFMDAVKDACEKIGIRAALGYGMLDFGNEEKREREIKETERFFSLFEKDKDDLTFPVLAPHSIYTCSREILEWCVEFAKEKKSLLTIHLSETRKEVYDCLKMNGKRPVPYLADLGFNDVPSIYFHASFLTKDEIRLLGKAKRKCSVVNCPASNMKLATGGCFPFREYIENDVNVCLGTDGACSNNSLDMFEEMKFSALLQKWFRWNGEEMKAKDALKMATVNGYKAYGLNGGRIKEGFLADLITLDLNNISLLPLNDVSSNLVYSVKGNAVLDVLVNGNLVMLDRKIINVDEEKVKNEFLKHVSKLIPEEIKDDR